MPRFDSTAHISTLISDILYSEAEYGSSDSHYLAPLSAPSPSSFQERLDASRAVLTRMSPSLISLSRARVITAVISRVLL